jgi:hypothetical protein
MGCLRGAKAPLSIYLPLPLIEGEGDTGDRVTIFIYLTPLIPLSFIASKERGRNI